MAAPLRRDAVDAIPDLVASADNSSSSSSQNSNSMEIENSSPVQRIHRSQGNAPMPDTSEVIEESYFEEEVHILLDESGQDSQNIITYTKQIIEFVEQEVTESEANDEFIGDFIEEIMEEEVTESEIIEEEVTESEPNEFIGDFIEKKVVIDVDELIARNRAGDDGSDQSELARINASVAIPGQKDTILGDVDMESEVNALGKGEKNDGIYVSTESIPASPHIGTANQEETTERLYSAMCHALDALDQHYPNAFLEPNPSLTNTSSTAVTERRPREDPSSDLEWAVQKTVEVIYPEPFCVPELQNLPNERRMNNSQPKHTSPPTSEHSEGSLIQRSTDDAPVVEKKDDDDDEVPFDEVGPIPQKSPTSDESNKVTAHEQSKLTTSSQEPETETALAEHLPGRSSPPSDISVNSPSDGSISRPPENGNERALESDNTLDVSSVASNRMPSLSSTTASAEEEREQEQEAVNILPSHYAPISNRRDQNKQPLSPILPSQQKRTQQQSSPIHVSRHHLYSQDDRDLEAQHETRKAATVQKARQPSDNADDIFTPGWLEREREKEIAKFENIKSTLRVVLLTLLVTAPFAVGAFLTLRKEADDDD